MRNFYFVLIAVFAVNCAYVNNAIANEQPETVCYLKNKLPKPETSWTGDKSGIQGTNDWGDETYANSFTSDNGAFIFGNNYSISAYGNYWSGFGYTNTSDIATSNSANMSAITGKGISDDPALAYIIAFTGTTPAITFTENTSYKNLGMYVTNATYSYLSMKNGDDYAKKFGGNNGDTPDWFKLTATGYNQAGTETGTADFYLADLRSDNSSEDYIVNEWKWFDLSPLGSAASISFSMSSSDMGEWGMNTPGYFCIDGLKGVMDGTAIDIEDTNNATSNIYYAAGSLYIQGLANAEIRVADIAGATVAAFIADSETVPLNLSEGIYIIQAVKEGKTTTRKIVVR